MLTVESNDPAARVLPLGAQATDRTVFRCPVVSSDASAKLIFAAGLEWAGGEEDEYGMEDRYDHKRIDLSPEQDARSGWTGFHATAQTRSA